MTQREPDRCEAKAREMFAWLDRRFGKECGHNHANDYDPPPYSQGARPDTYEYLAAALRAEAAEALERAAQRIAWIQPEYTAHEAQRQIRALKPPAAAPAADYDPITAPIPEG